MDAVVSRLHNALAHALQTRKGGRDGQPVSVAEIYQELVPYRNVRSAIGVEMNADYEYALLRLLAGEGNFARIEPVEAREALRLEIGSPNPNVTLYRKYAGCDVWVDLDRLSAPLLTGQGEPEAQPGLSSVEAASAEALIPRMYTPPIRTSSSAFAFSEIEDAGRGAHPGIEESDPLEDLSFAARDGQEYADDDFDDFVSQASPVCATCSGPLPLGRIVNFCPHCGADQRRLDCASCGEPVEHDWRFCPACGATVADRASGGA